jgi:hypothetical protein
MGSERRKVGRVERWYILCIFHLSYLTFIMLRICEMEVYNKVSTFRSYGVVRAAGWRAFIPVQLRGLKMKSRWMSCRLNGSCLHKPDIAAPSFSENKENWRNISYSIPLRSIIYTSPTFKVRQLGEEHWERKSLFLGLSS